MSWKKKAESKYLAVAVSSIIAHNLFLQNLEDLGKELGFNLPSGAGAKSDQVAAKLLQTTDEGSGLLCQLHFKNTENKEITRKISYVKRSSKQSSSSPVVRFLKNGASSVLLLVSLSPLASTSGLRSSGRPFDGSNLQISEYLLVVNHLSIDRSTLSLPMKKDDDGKTKDIVKRVIGLPGDTIQYDNDTLYINGKKTNEPYLKDYRSFQKR